MDIPTRISRAPPCELLTELPEVLLHVKKICFNPFPFFAASLQLEDLNLWSSRLRRQGWKFKHVNLKGCSTGTAVLAQSPSQTQNEFHHLQHIIDQIFCSPHGIGSSVPSLDPPAVAVRSGKMLSQGVQAGPARADDGQCLGAPGHAVDWLAVPVLAAILAHCADDIVQKSTPTTRQKASRRCLPITSNVGTGTPKPKRHLYQSELVRVNSMAPNTLSCIVRGGGGGGGRHGFTYFGICPCELYSCSHRGRSSASIQLLKSKKISLHVQNLQSSFFMAVKSFVVI